MEGDTTEKRSKLDWVMDVEIEELLTGDLRFIHECCGLEIVLKLLDNFPSMTLYISTKPLTEAKKRYIKKHYNGKNTKELCSMLGISERFVYEAMKDISYQQERLFNDPL